MKAAIEQELRLEALRLANGRVKKSAEPPEVVKVAELFYRYLNGEIKVAFGGEGESTPAPEGATKQ